MDSVDTDPLISNEDKVLNKIKKLIQLRDSLLNLNLIFVILDSEDDAYLIFETLNTRGKDLAVTDLVKNHFTKLLKSKGSVDAAKMKWSQILETIHNSSADISSDTFIYHFWASRYDAIPLKKLFPIFRKSVTKDNAKDMLDDLLEDSKLYRSIHEPTYRWAKNEIQVSRSLKAIQLFKLSQPTPAILALVRAHKNGVIKYSKLRDSLQSIEKFHFIFTAVTSSRSSGGISAMYSSFARKLFEAKSSEEASVEISALTLKLRNKRPSFDEFKVAFREISFTNSNSKQKNLVKYILRGFSEHSQYKFPVDFDDLTIEHIQPQSKVGNDGWTEENVGQLGNLIFLDQKMNGKLDTKPFKEKVELLAIEGYSIPTGLDCVEHWTEEEAKAHTDRMAAIAFDEIWKI